VRGGKRVRIGSALAVLVASPFDAFLYVALLLAIRPAAVRVRIPIYRDGKKMARPTGRNWALLGRNAFPLTPGLNYGRSRLTDGDWKWASKRS